MIVIVGGGVIGICCAYELARRGAAVTVLERDRIAGAASFGNAGSLAPGHAPINRPGVDRLALRWMFRPASPIHIAPAALPRIGGWLWRFRRFCTKRHFEYATGVLSALGHRSQELADRWVADEALDCDYRNDGYYEIYATREGLDRGREEMRRLERQGYTPRELRPEQMREREPALRESLAGAVWHPEGATCNPQRFVQQLAERARRHGATVREHAAVAALELDGGRVRGVRLEDGERIEAATVLLATGAYSQRLLSDLGIRLPVQPAKGYHRDATPGAGSVPPLRVSCLLGESLIFCSPMGAFVRLAGTLEFSGLNHEIRRERLAQLTIGARDYFHEVGDGGTRSEWCGLRPCLPDGLPAIGRVPGIDGLLLANGHAMMGVTLGPVTGELVGQAILDDKSSFELGPLRVERF